jgi:hypothetical protein
MIEMGSSFGKMFRELRAATRDMSWSNLMGSHDDEAPRSQRDDSLARLSEYTKSYNAANSTPSSAPGISQGKIVDGSVERVEDPSKN